MTRATYTKTLPNGLALLGEANDAHSSVSVGFFVRTGARDEVGPEAGVSHFLEHMMFKGTKKRSALEITFELGNIGAQANAFTSEENTVYYAQILPEHFDQMHDLLCDMLRPALDQAEFDTEKKVILEEIALYQDRPAFSLFERALAAYYGDHPAGNSVLGTTQTITDVTRDQMRGYFDRRYLPNNLVLVASGKFSWDDFVRRSEERCGSWQSGETPRKIASHRAKEAKQSWTKKDLNQVHLLWITDGASAQEEERYPLGLLSTIIGDPSGSRLYWDLIDPGIVDSASADNDERDGTGCFTVYASTEPDRVPEVTDKIEKILRTPREFTEEDLTRAKNKLVSRIVLDGELPMGRLMALGFEWIYRQRLSSLREVIEKVHAVSRADIERTLEKYPLKTWSRYSLVPA